MNSEVLTLDSVNERIKDLSKKGYNIPGVLCYTEMASFMRPSIRVVEVDTNPANGEIYSVGGNKFGLARPAIMNFRDAGRIEFIMPPNNIEVTRGNGIHKITARVVGERYDLDGAPKRIEDMKTMDLIVREEEMKEKYWKIVQKDHKDWSHDQQSAFVEKNARRVMIEKHKFASEMAITGAQIRVVQKLLGLKPAYTIPELKKPFVIVSVTPVVDMHDPDIKRMVTAKLLGIKEALYPTAAGSAAPYPVLVDADGRGEKDMIPSSDAPLEIGHDNTLGDFSEYPRAMRESILKGMIRDDEMASRIPSLRDQELESLFVKCKAAA